MNEEAGFQITYEPQEGPASGKAGIQIHQDRGEHHYYGAIMVVPKHRDVLLSVRQQLVYAMLDIVDEVMKWTESDFETVMQPVDRPF